MANEEALTFNRTSKLGAHISYKGVYLNRDASLDQHQVKVTVAHENQKQDIFFKVKVINGGLDVQCPDTWTLLPAQQEEASKFAQSIVAFYQDKDSYAMSLLENLA